MDKNFKSFSTSKVYKNNANLGELFLLQQTI